MSNKKIIPLYSLNVKDFNSMEDYETKYDENCDLVENIILEKNIPLHKPICALTNNMNLFEGFLGSILNYFSATLSLDFIVFEDGFCGFIKTDGSWIKLISDIVVLKDYIDNERGIE